MLKFFCKHDWKIHSSKKYNWSKTTIVKGTEIWFRPKLEENQYSKTIEILICKKCGKINKIIY